MSLSDMYDDDEQWSLYNSLLNADDDDPFFNMEEIEELLNKMDKELAQVLNESKKDATVALKCECGAEKCRLPSHSDWCPKYKL
jgi:Zn-dependent M32 family carboxypeptidase